MKHLRIFNSMEEFEAVKSSIDTPFVVLEEGTGKLIHSNLIEITEDDITSGDYVDLGLPSGTIWSTCNLGATIPCEYGLLYQFGRVDGYAYGDTNNQFRTKEQNTADTGNERIPKTTSGKTYNEGDVLGIEDDAAYVASNGAMRMPTQDECQELLDNTTNQWVSRRVMGGEHTSHNVMGRLFTSKTDSSKTMFLPAAGCFYGGGNFAHAGIYGFYWTSVLENSNLNGGQLEFTSENCFLNSNVRFYGFSVRGVRNN